MFDIRTLHYLFVSTCSIAHLAQNIPFDIWCSTVMRVKLGTYGLRISRLFTKLFVLFYGYLVVTCAETDDAYLFLYFKIKDRMLTRHL